MDIHALVHGSPFFELATLLALAACVVALATGLGQVAFTSIAGFGIGLPLSLDAVTAARAAVALTSSNTIIIVRLLSDSRDADSLHGRIAVPGHRASEVEALEAKGADLVLLPFRDAADRAARLLLEPPPDPLAGGDP